MEEGYVLDSVATQTKSETWTKGNPPKSVWACLTEGDKKSFEVIIYRCTNCGYLESYAATEKQNY